MLIAGAMLAGCSTERTQLPQTQQILSEVAAAQQRPLELPDAQKRLVLDALARSKRGERRFSDPELNRDVFASFWRSPLDKQVDRSRLLLVRYSEDGSYVYVGFDKDGRLFTDGAGSIFADPPWAQ
jgi:hypothetical protein